MIKREESLRYVAAIPQPHCQERLHAQSYCSCLDEDQEQQLEKFVCYRLKKILACTNFYSYFSNHLGVWHVKGIQGWTFVVVTSEAYPQDVAVECIDEFSEAYGRVSKGFFAKRRAKAQSACCQAVFDKFATLEVETAPWFLMHQVDDCSRKEYSKSMKHLFNKIDGLRDKMHENIQKELDNMEKAEELQELTNDCLEKAQVFRKKAKQVKWQIRMKNGVFNAKGVVACAAIGGAVGFLAGGPGGAFALTGMSLAEAQAIEASVAAFVFGVGFYAAQSKVENWSWSQPIVLL